MGMNGLCVGKMISVDRPHFNVSVGTFALYIQWRIQESDDVFAHFRDNK